MQKLQKRWSEIFPAPPPAIADAARRAIGIVQLRSVCRIAGLWEPYAQQTHHDLPLPPVHLRRRTGSGTSIGSFLSLGQTIFRDLEKGLATVGKNLASFQSVFDFGCSCGRVLRWFAYQPNPPQLAGSDVDSEAIAWCRHHFPFGRFTTNRPLPSVFFTNASFDLVYAISVFTHLDEAAQFLWLEELRRVMLPGGYLLLSVLGESVWKQLPPPLLSRFAPDRKGFLFVDWDMHQGLLPVWSETTYHHQEYIQQHFGRYFDILAHIPQGINNHQDLVILRKS